MIPNVFKIIFKGASLKHEKHIENVGRCKDGLHLEAGLLQRLARDSWLVHGENAIFCHVLS